MDGVRAMETVIESPLDRALTDVELIKKYPEAAKLLREVRVPGMVMCAIHQHFYEYE